MVLQLGSPDVRPSVDESHPELLVALGLCVCCLLASACSSAALRVLEDPETRCDGVDDDADGLIDDGFPDSDGDGEADCTDTECELELQVPIVTQAVCANPDPIEGFWELEVEEHWMPPASLGLSGSVVQVLLSTPASSESSRGGIYGYDASGSDRASFVLGSDGAASVIADGPIYMETLVRPSGREEPGLLVLNGAGTRTLSLLDSAGSTVWETETSVEPIHGHIAVGDMNCDGVPDLANARQVYSGDDGTTLLDLPNADPGLHPKLLVDLDDDGCAELIHGGVAYSAQGTALWSVPSEQYDWWQPVQLDDDPYPEFVVVQTTGGLQVDHDGSVLASGLFATGFAGAPCVANLDSDPEPEIAFLVLGSEDAPGRFGAYDLDGAELWTVPVDADAGFMGCTAHDFDGDGRFEVLFRDTSTFWIRDGQTGEERVSVPGVGVRGDFSYPVPVDIDGDLSTEILLGVELDEDGEPGGVLILGHPSSAFLPGAAAWTSFDNRLSNIDATGRSPLDAPPSWLDHNSVRAAPVVARSYADLAPVLVDSCLSGCSGSSVVQYAVTVANQGAAASGPETLVELWSIDEAGEPVELRESWTLGPIEPGETSEVWTLSLPWNDGPQRGFELIVDGVGLGATAECDEGNNTLELVRPPCP